MNLRLIAAGIVLAALVGGGWYLRHLGYEDGRADCNAEMAAKVAEATLRATQIENAANSRAWFRENRHAEQIADLEARHSAAVGRLERRLRELASDRPMPEAPAAPGPGHGGSDGRGSDRGNGSLDPLLADVGRITRQLAERGRESERCRIALATLQDYGRQIEQFRAQLSDEPR